MPKKIWENLQKQDAVVKELQDLSSTNNPEIVKSGL